MIAASSAVIALVAGLFVAALVLIKAVGLAIALPFWVYQAFWVSVAYVVLIELLIQLRQDAPESSVAKDNTDAHNQDQ